MTAQDRIVLPDWPRLMPVQTAAQYLGIGETTLRGLGIEGRKIGKRVLYDRIDLDRYADALGGQPLDDIEREAEAEGLLKRVQDRLNG